MNRFRSTRRRQGVVVAVLFVMAVLAGGCGETRTGVYRADVEQVSPTASPPKGYSLEEVRGKLAAEPEEIELRSGGRFVLRRAGEVIWEGQWRREDDRLLLRAEVVLGTAVVPALQQDKSYRFRSGAIVDEGSFGAYGLHLVYRKR